MDVRCVSALRVGTLMLLVFVLVGGTEGRISRQEKEPPAGSRDGRAGGRGKQQVGRTPPTKSVSKRAGGGGGVRGGSPPTTGSSEGVAGGRTQSVDTGGRGKQPSKSASSRKQGGALQKVSALFKPRGARRKVSAGAAEPEEPTGASADESIQQLELPLPTIFADSALGAFYDKNSKVLHELKMRGKELEEQRNADKAKVEDDELEFAAWKIKSDLEQEEWHTYKEEQKKSLHDEAEALQEAAMAVKNKPLGYKPGGRVLSVKNMATLPIYPGHLQQWERALREQDRGVIMHRLRSGSCAIVGNSGLLANTTYGADIDRHDVVIRMNSAPTKGHEAAVGIKTDARCMNNALVRLLIEKVEEWPDHIRIAVMGEESVQLWLRATVNKTRELKEALEAKGDHRVVVRLDDDMTYSSLRLFHEFYAGILENAQQVARVKGDTAREAEMQGRIQKMRDNPAKLNADDYGKHGDPIFGKPTTGMGVLYALKDVCKAVTLYGFGTHDEAGLPVAYKYYTPDSNTTLAGNLHTGTVGSHAHSFSLEQELLHAMDLSGVLKLCSFVPGDAAHNAHCIHSMVS